MPNLLLPFDRLLWKAEIPGIAWQLINGKKERTGFYLIKAHQGPNWYWGFDASHKLGEWDTSGEAMERVMYIAKERRQAAFDARGRRPVPTVRPRKQDGTAKPKKVSARTMPLPGLESDGNQTHRDNN